MSRRPGFRTPKRRCAAPPPEIRNLRNFSCGLNFSRRSCPLIDVLTPILVTAIFALVYRWTGVQVEQKHMLALQSALQNGARLLLTGKSVSDAVGYVQRSVPDALTALKAQSPERIAELLAPHIAALPPGRVPISAEAIEAWTTKVLGIEPITMPEVVP